jgi:hypothetical protein
MDEITEKIILYITERCKKIFTWKFNRDAVITILVVLLIVYVYPYASNSYEEHNKAVAFDMLKTACNGKPVMMSCANGMLLNYSSSSLPINSSSISSSS